MKGRAGVLLIVLACAGSPCLAQASGAVIASSSSVLPGASVTVEVHLDVAATGQDLGSYGAVLSWDPAVLQYAGATGGPYPFDTPVVNASAAGSGALSIADADAIGAAGNVIAFDVHFQVIGYPCDLSAVTLSMTSMHASVTLDNLLPLSSVQNATIEVKDHVFDLRAVNEAATVLVWNTIPSAASYDVIRFPPAGLYEDPVTVHLGTVVCWEDDSLDATTGAGTEAANPDMDPLPPGQAFFYLVRARIGASNLTYGFTGACARERLPDASDCP